LNAEPQQHVNNFVFAAEGDIVDVTEVQTLNLSAMDPISGQWGVALMRFQANLPTDQLDQNATLVLFGDVQLENAVEATNLIDITSTISGNANIRLSPSSEAPVLGTLAPNNLITGNGRLEDSSWIRVQLVNGRTGWISAELVTSDDGFDTLDVVTPTAPYYGPMQAFYFTSGEDDSACPEAPNSGIVIQTPEGEAEVNLLINEVNIQIGSTVYFQAVPGAQMTVTVVEGEARVISHGVVQYAPAGSQLDIPMDEDMHPAGPPTSARPYRMEDVSSLPIGLLERAITIHPPMTPEEIEAEAEEAAAEDGLTTPSEDGGWETAPGLNGNVPPGQGGDTPPGQTGNNGNAGGNSKNE
jgi:hypothetical protein